MNDEKAIQLLRSSNLDDIQIGFELLMKKYGNMEEFNKAIEYTNIRLYRHQQSPYEPYLLITNYKGSHRYIVLKTLNHED